jgi:hypothetical protein
MEELFRYYSYHLSQRNHIENQLSIATRQGLTRDNDKITYYLYYSPTKTIRYRREVESDLNYEKEALRLVKSGIRNRIIEEEKMLTDKEKISLLRRKKNN